MTTLNAQMLLEGVTDDVWSANVEKRPSPGVGHWYVVEAADNAIGEFYGDDHETNAANLRLAASAPRLARRVIELERALREIAETGKGHKLNWGDAQDAIDIARAALNGEQTA